MDFKVPIVQREFVPLELPGLMMQLRLILLMQLRNVPTVVFARESMVGFNILILLVLTYVF
jgi:hypothetical protein